MWLKLDDGFATHPKVLAAGAICALIQVRAICYASREWTDGFIPTAAVSLFLVGLEAVGLELERMGTVATVGRQANDIDWGPRMVEAKLWDVRPGGYYVHDYLEWNLSKAEYESFINKKRKAGKKGMKARWGKGSEGLTPVITHAITDDITKRYHPISTSSSLKSSLNSPDPEWFESLKKNPLYSHVDFARERGKMDLWKSQPANRNRKLTAKFVINWLNKIEPPLPNGRGNTRPPPFPPKTDPIARGQWRTAYGDPAKYGYE